jgi:hypothetical protein
MHAISNQRFSRKGWASRRVGRSKDSLRRASLLSGLGLVCLLVTGSLAPRGGHAAETTDAKDRNPAEQAEGWHPLFDGTTLAGWESTPFGGEGQVTVEEGAIRLERGSELSGITWQKDFPQDGYAITLEAQRVDGYDFFCGLTFPIGEQPCSFIVGGWGGGVVGLSSIDGADAAHNDTTEWKEFKTGQWYRITVEVSQQAIRCWIDDEMLVDQPRGEHEFSIRPEVFLSRPLGISCYGTVAALRDIRYRVFDATSDVKKAAE